MDVFPKEKLQKRLDELNAQTKLLNDFLKYYQENEFIHDSPNDEIVELYFMSKHWEQFAGNSK